MLPGLKYHKSQGNLWFSCDNCTLKDAYCFVFQSNIGFLQKWKLLPRSWNHQSDGKTDGWKTGEQATEFLVYKQERNKMKGSQLRVLRGKINLADVLVHGEGRGCHHELEKGQGGTQPSNHQHPSGARRDEPQQKQGRGSGFGQERVRHRKTVEKCTEK